VCPRALCRCHADAPNCQAHIPVGRLGEPEEIAGIVEMLVKVPYMTNKVDCGLARSVRTDGAVSRRLSPRMEGGRRVYRCSTKMDGQTDNANVSFSFRGVGSATAWVAFG
jgi:hypothetical protein